MCTYLFDIIMNSPFYRGLVASCSDTAENAEEQACQTLQILKRARVAECRLVATCENFSTAMENYPIAPGETVILA